MTSPKARLEQDAPGIGTDPAAARRELLLLRLRGQRAGDGAPPRVADRTGPIPLSFGQQRLWFLDQLTPGSTEYVVPMFLRLRGPLDIGALTAAITTVVTRHEVLRTRYVVADGEPVQVIDPPQPVSLPVEQVPESALADALRAWVDQPFDLARGPVWRASLLRLGPDDHVLAFTAHHIACDGWSMSVIGRELATGYEACAAGHDPGLPPPGAQYADFAVWQRETLSGPRLEGPLRHWQDQLAGLEPLRLPVDRPRPSPRDPRGARVRFEVPADVSARVRELGRARGGTPYATLLAGFAVLLSKLTGQRDIAVGTPMAGRARDEFENSVGFFVSTVVLRCDLSGDPSFDEAIDRVGRTTLDAASHQDVPFERLVQALEPERDLSRTPLVDTMFLLECASDAEPPRMCGIEVGEIPVASPTVKVDLTLGIRELPDGSLLGAIEYATALFDDATMRRTAQRYVDLLAQATRDPAVRLSQLSALTPEERRTLGEWNDRPAPVPDRTLHGLVDEQVAATPGAAAVVAVDGQLSYAELSARANRMAHELRARGVGRGSVVAVCLRRELDLVVALLAVLRAGASFLPLDPDHPEARLRRLARDADVAAIVSRQRFAERFPNTAPLLLVDAEADALAARSPATPLDGCGPDDLAYVMYTSGSTGQPKGVMIPHRGIVNRLTWMQDRYRLVAEDRVLQKTTYTFDVSLWEFFWPLSVGARLVLAPPHAHLDPVALAEWMTEQRVTHLHFVPSMLDVFLDVNRDFPESCREVFCSGESLRAATVRRFFARSAARLHNLYGPTEASVDVTAYETSRTTRADPVPIGAPIHNTQVHVLDDDLNTVPIGGTGEIYLGGIGLARGYLNQPALTAERLVPDPFGPSGSRLYRTGDRGRWRSDGMVEFQGRIDNQFKIRGLRIEPDEIEAALRSHPAVAAAAVAMRRPRDGGDPFLAAYVTWADGGEAPISELREQLSQRLPGYMVPVRYLALDRLPLTASGKVDRKALPDPQPVQARGRPADVTMTAVESVIAAAWAQVLGGGAVGIADNFFDLGGDSMRAVRVVGVLRERGIEVSVADLFRDPTVAALAAIARAPELRVDDRRCAPFELLDDGDRRHLPGDLADAYPLSEVQAGMLFEMLADEAVLPYHNVTSYAVRDDAEFSPAALRAAAADVAHRHEALRTSFDLTSYREPLQLVHRTARPEVAVDDLRGLTGDEQRTEIARAAAHERSVLFDLGRAPLWRLRAHRTSDHEWWLSMVECHAILDGWSHNSLLTELLGRYRAIRDASTGGELQPPPAVRFADFVAAERAALASEEHREFWRQKLRHHAHTRIPAAWGNPTAGERVSTSHVPVQDLVPGLRELAAAAGAPLKSVFLAAYLRVLRSMFAGPAPTVGLISNGRLETGGGDEVYGMFLNTVPFVAEPGAAATWRETVAEVFAEETALWPYRRYPLPALQRLVGAGSPLIETTFNYLDFYTVDQQAVDLRQTADDSPNEFPLVVTVVPDHLQFTVRESRVSAEHAARLGELWRSVLAAMSGSPHGPAEWAVPDPGWQAPRLVAESCAMVSGSIPGAGTPPAAGPPVTVTTPGLLTANGAAAPDLERVIAGVWATALDLDRVAPDDDFVAIGGHSLTAMRVSAKLRAEHGIDVTPREVLRSRTVAALASAVRGRRGDRRATGDAQPDGTLVWLRQSGDRAPLICLHPGGGGVHWYRELADALPADLPVAAVQHPGVLDPDEAGCAVEELAERYLTDLRAAVGSGPYRLLGWCGGAPVTWELGRRLMAAGEQVVTVLLDPALEGLACSDGPPEQLLLLRCCEALLEQLRSDPARAGTTERREEIVGLLYQVVDDDRAHAVIKADELDGGWLGAVRVWRRLAESRLAYRFTRHPGSVDLILGDELAEGEHVALGDHDYDGYVAQWSALVTGSVRLHRIPGSHVGVLRPPQVTELGQLIGHLVGSDRPNQMG